MTDEQLKLAETRLKSIRGHIVHFIDSGASNAHPIKVSNGDLCEWFDGLEIVSVHLRAATRPAPTEAAFAEELRKYWSFDDGQMHTHSWHDRENFIKRKLPSMLAALSVGEAK